MKKSGLIIISLFANVCLSFGQDTFYSNPEISSLYSNPANAGMIGGNNNTRVSFMYRPQWVASEKVFSNFYSEISSRVIVSPFFNFSGGIMFNQNKQGIGALEFNQLNIPLGGTFNFDPSKLISGKFIKKFVFKNGFKHQVIFSINFNPSFHFASIDYDKFILNDQIVLRNQGGISQDLAGFQLEQFNGRNYGIGFNVIKVKELKNQFTRSFNIGYSNNNLRNNENITILNNDFNLNQRSTFYIKIKEIRKSSDDRNLFKTSFLFHYWNQNSNPIQARNSATFSQTLIGGSFGLPFKSLKIGDESKIYNYQRFIEVGYSFKGLSFSQIPTLNNSFFHVINLKYLNLDNGTIGGFSFDIATRNNPIRNFGGLTMEIFFTRYLPSDFLNLLKNKRKGNRVRELKCWY